MGKKFVVITNCTARKRAGIPLIDFAPKGEGIQQIADDWRRSLEAQPTPLQAGKMYVGRSIVEAKNISQHLGARLFIVSAGIGLVASDKLIPGYNISASGKQTELVKTLTKFRASKSDWWHLLASGSGLKSLLHEHPDVTILLSLPSEYLDMVLEDLGAAPLEDLTRVRVFTSIAGQKKIEQLPGLAALPYDERLESIAGYAGTRSDFPQRALKHFVYALNGHLLPLNEASYAVRFALEAYKHKETPNRRRLDDGSICDLIRDAWDNFGGNSANLLRHLRDEELVACEQGRFARLRRQVEVALKETGRQSGSQS